MAPVAKCCMYYSAMWLVSQGRTSWALCFSRTGRFLFLGLVFPLCRCLSFRFFISALSRSSFLQAMPFFMMRKETGREYDVQHTNQENVQPSPEGANHG